MLQKSVPAATLRVSGYLEPADGQVRVTGHLQTWNGQRVHDVLQHETHARGNVEKL